MADRDVRLLSKQTLSEIAEYFDGYSATAFQIRGLLGHIAALNEALATVSPARLREIAGFLEDRLQVGSSEDLLRFASALESATQPAEATGTEPANR